MIYSNTFNCLFCSGIKDSDHWHSILRNWGWRNLRDKNQWSRKPWRRNSFKFDSIPRILQEPTLLSKVLLKFSLVLYQIILTVAENALRCNTFSLDPPKNGGSKEAKSIGDPKRGVRRDSPIILPSIIWIILM